jgi:hypothetical protein
MYEVPRLKDCIQYLNSRVHLHFKEFPWIQVHLETPQTQISIHLEQGSLEEEGIYIY